MKKLIKLIVVSLCLFVFSTPVLASDYAHTIEHILFQGYKEDGVSITVTTNIDTEEDATLYLAVYSDEGFLLESVSKPLDQTMEDERKVHKLKISTILDETMTAKAFVWKDMMPVALSLSKKYDDKYNSGTEIVAPDTKDYILNIPDGTINSDDKEDSLLDIVTPDESSNVVDYPINNSTGQIDAVIPGGSIGEEYEGSYGNRIPIGTDVIPGKKYDIYLDADGKLVNVSN